MASKKTKKYYAIKKGINTENKIVRTWSECEKLVKGYPAIYKSFKSEEEAKEYLGSIQNIEKKQEENKKAMEFNKKRKKNTVSLSGIRIKKELYAELEAKCKEYNWNIEFAIKKLIEEWVI